MSAFLIEYVRLESYQIGGSSDYSRFTALEVPRAAIIFVQLKMLLEFLACLNGCLWLVQTKLQQNPPQSSS